MILIMIIVVIIMMMIVILLIIIIIIIVIIIKIININYNNLNNTSDNNNNGNIRSNNYDSIITVVVRMIGTMININNNFITIQMKILSKKVEQINFSCATIYIHVHHPHTNTDTHCISLYKYKFSKDRISFQHFPLIIFYSPRIPTVGLIYRCYGNVF